jgi:TPR repeat protein
MDKDMSHKILLEAALELAKNRNLEAMFLLGVYHLFGEKGAEKNDSKARTLFQESAAGGNESSKFALKFMDMTKEEIRSTNSLETLQSYQNKVEEFIPAALFQLGDLTHYRELKLGVLDKKEVILKAVKWWTMAAELGNPEAQLTMARLYEEGREIPQDLNKSLEWFQKAAENNNPFAMFELAMKYFNGVGVEEDVDIAFSKFQMASELNCAPAQYYLSLMYFQGRGVERDFAKAISWLKKSAENGYFNAQNDLNLMRLPSIESDADPAAIA